MKLLLIETNKGHKIDNGFRHTVFECARINGNMNLEVVASCKFSDVLTDQLHINSFTKDPDAFLKELEDEE